MSCSASATKWRADVAFSRATALLEDSGLKEISKAVLSKGYLIAVADSRRLIELAVVLKAGHSSARMADRPKPILDNASDWVRQSTICTSMCSWMPSTLQRILVREI